MNFIGSQIQIEQEAQKLASRIPYPFCLALWGNLGSGKTTFARAFIRSFMKDPDLIVPSPTFTLVQYYTNDEELSLWHCDLYRLQDQLEIESLGILDALGREGLLIEWPELMGPYLPKNCTDIHLSWVDEDLRSLEIFEKKG
jgi:tRNA threonylcarbamoyl adenosine modification protein YjeE